MSLKQTLHTTAITPDNHQPNDNHTQQPSQTTVITPNNNCIQQLSQPANIAPNNHHTQQPSPNSHRTTTTAPNSHHPTAIAPSSHHTTIASNSHHKTTTTQQPSHNTHHTKQPLRPTITQQPSHNNHCIQQSSQNDHHPTAIAMNNHCTQHPSHPTPVAPPRPTRPQCAHARSRRELLSPCAHARGAPVALSGWVGMRPRGADGSSGGKGGRAAAWGELRSAAVSSARPRCVGLRRGPGAGLRLGGSLEYSRVAAGCGVVPGRRSAAARRRLRGPGGARGALL